MGQYDHHKEFLKDNPETLVQPETLELEHGRTLKNRTFQVLPKENPLNHPLRQCAAPKKESVHSIKKAIDGHHTQTTNRGYQGSQMVAFSLHNHVYYCVLLLTNSAIY